MDKAYRFTAGGRENHWESVQRLSEEGALAVPSVDNVLREHLRIRTDQRSASRAKMSRSEFIRSLLAGG